VREQSREPEDAGEAHQPSEQKLAMEIDAAERLQHVATELINAQGTAALYEQTLDTAMAILRADFSCIQMFHPERGTSGELRLLGHRGLTAEAARRYEWVRPTTLTTCGEALRRGRRVAVPDFRNCDFMSGSDDLDGYLGAEILAGQTTPLVSRSGALMGMVSTYWREPHELAAHEIRALDVLARMAADLIERSRAEERLSESERHLRNAERLARVGHWQWDIRANQVSGSEEMFRIFGKPQDHLPSYEGFLQDLRPKDRERVEQLIGDSLATRMGHSIEYQIDHPDGDQRTISCIWEVALDKEGLPVRLFGTCQDITDSRRAQEESFAKQKLESLGVLAAGIAHDFNNLLGGVLAHSELGLAELAAGSTPEEELRSIRDAAIRGGEIVEQLMVYAGEETEALKLVNVSGIVKDMLELLKFSVSKHVRVKTNLGQQLRAVRANPSQLRQVVMNLFYNASEAIGDRDGVIRVTTEEVTISPDSPLATSDPTADGVYVQLEVSDTGRGMTPEVQARIFEPFFSTKPTGSHGLGLATIQGITERLHGIIRVSSEPGKGSTFQIMLPCGEQIPEATRSGIARAECDTFSCRGATILVVEDEDLLRQGVSRMLRKEGLSVLEASDGSAALDVIRARKSDIDILLLDITLPGASSRTVYEEARRLRPGLPVIVTSAKSEGMAAAFLATEIEHFIRKPFRLGGLSDLIRQVLHSDMGTHANRATS
jgi:two-component system, cell cycle sensor histidine kinase and response regulator CckA